MLLNLNFYDHYLRKLLLLVFLFASLNGATQTFTLSFQRAPLTTVISQIEQRSDYRFLYTEELLAQSVPVSFTVKNASLDSVLFLSFHRQPLGYSIEGKHIIIRKKGIEKPTIAARELRGKVVNEQGETVAGITLAIKQTGLSTVSDANGEFIFKEAPSKIVLIVTGAEVLVQELDLGHNTYAYVVVQPKVSVLDETVVIGYGTTTKRFGTGSVTKVSGDEIARQPVTNPLLALQGRVPGLIITSTSGMPGAAVRIQIRGQNSVNPNPNASGINPLDNPLFIIDGVPFAPQNSSINQYNSLASPGTNAIYGNPYGGISPFSLINPNDIETIEVLRDADATAIYGSRGANGVILITTKKAKIGKSVVSINFNSGLSIITRSMPMMNTSQYLQMRKEAFSNDGLVPSPNPTDSKYAPDLLFFDSTRNVDWKDYFIGNTATLNKLSASLSGGSEYTNFLISGNYVKETSIYPGTIDNQVGSVSLNLHHRSSNKRLSTDFSAAYSYNHNRSSGMAELLRAFTLAPNYPELLNPDGTIKWYYNSADLFDNPIASLRRPYHSKAFNLISNLTLEYEIVQGLILKSNLGYNSLNGDEQSQAPKASQSPTFSNSSVSYFGNNEFKTWIIEPQLTYNKKIKNLSFNILVGSTLQKNSNSFTAVEGSNYSDDNLLGSISAAGTKIVNDGFSEYKYSAAFGRVGAIWKSKYILNLNGRRDGSSRFGPNKQFGNFGSLGMGWIFSEESIVKKKLGFISFGKLRASYGTTGSDNIANYLYLSRWGNSGNPYQNIPGYSPQNLFNPDLRWSTTKKLEISGDFGFLKNKILTTVTWYRNRCGNQLVTYALPYQTGFSGVTSNFPALVQNKGWEISLQSTNLSRKEITWKTTFNITFSKNRLLSFPGLETSSYANIYIVGQSLNVLNKFKLSGVNPSTGIYEFVTKSGALSSNPTDYLDFNIMGSTDPKFSGGLGNYFLHHNFEMDLFFEFRKQIGANYLQQVYSYGPAGAYINMPSAMMGRWQKPGDNTSLAKFTYRRTTTTGRSIRNFTFSDAAYTDASFVRLKNISISYTVKAKWQERIKVKNLKLYINAQNLFILTKYKGNDPETQSFYSLPPLTSIVAGFQLTF